MSRSSRFLALAVVACAAVAFFYYTYRSRSESPEGPILAAVAPDQPVRAMMAGIIDPAADVLWDTTGTRITTTGIVEGLPKTEEEWATVRMNARMLIEASELIQVPGRPIAGPGEKSTLPGVELEPEQIQANVNKDREKWNQFAKEFHDTSVKLLQAVNEKDRAKLTDLGEELDVVCENCHLTFWYPE